MKNNNMHRLFRPVAAAIRRKNISFFGVYMLGFLLICLPWTVYLLCDYKSWIALEELNIYDLLFFFGLLQILLAVFSGLVPYIIYEKVRHKRWMYVCPVVQFVLCGCAIGGFGVQLDALVFCIVQTALYTLLIFVASRLAAPPEAKAE